MFLKLKHIHVAKLIKVEDSCSYEEIVNIARRKFPEIGEDAFFFCEEDGTIIEEDLLTDYVLTRNKDELMTLYIRKVHKFLSSDNFDDESQSFSTISVISVESPDNIVIEDDISMDAQHSKNIEASGSVELFAKPIPSKISNEEWKNLISSQGGGDIFAFYNKQGLLSNTLRQKLVKITCTLLREKYTIKCPEIHKINLAKSIVQLFPNLQDNMGETGYDAFYRNQHGGEGYIAWQFKTMAKNLKSEEEHLIKRRKRKSEKLPEAEDEHEASNVSKQKDVVLSDEISESIAFLKNACPKKDRESISKRMKFTYEYRKSLGNEVLNEFPRFQDTPGLIEEDFRLLYSSEVTVPNFLEAFLYDTDKILNTYKLTVSKPDPDIVEDSNSIPNWDKTTRALLAILHMLPKRGTAVDEEKLIIFKPVNIPIQEVIVTKNTLQPVLLAQGTNKKAINQYNILLDGKSIECPELCTSVKAFELLFMSHWVFNTKYDDQLKYFWEFMQTFYFKLHIDQVSFTPKMSELRSRIKN